MQDYNASMMTAYRETFVENCFTYHSVSRNKRGKKKSFAILVTLGYVESLSINDTNFELIKPPYRCNQHKSLAFLLVSFVSQSSIYIHHMPF